MNRKLITIISIGLICFIADFIYEGFRSIMYIFVREAGGNIVQACTIWGLGDLTVLIGRILGSITTILKTTPILEYVLGYILTGSLIIPTTTLSINTITISYIFERFGKGIRGPSRDIVIKLISKDVGKSFGIVEALDQAGATLGPILMLLVMNSRDFLVKIFEIFSISYIILILCLTYVIYRLHKFNVKSYVDVNVEHSRTISRRSILYCLGVLIISSTLFPIIGIQYMSLTSGNVYYGLIMFILSSIVSTIFSIPVGIFTKFRSSILITCIIPTTSILSVIFYNNPIIVGILYGISLAIVEVWFRGYAIHVKDPKVYSVVSTGIFSGLFTISILFPYLLNFGYCVCILYVITMFIVGISLIVRSILKF